MANPKFHVRVNKEVLARIDKGDLEGPPVDAREQVEPFVTEVPRWSQFRRELIGGVAPAPLKLIPALRSYPVYEIEMQEDGRTLYYVKTKDRRTMVWAGSWIFQGGDELPEETE